MAVLRGEGIGADLILWAAALTRIGEAGEEPGAGGAGGLWDTLLPALSLYLSGSCRTLCMWAGRTKRDRSHLSQVPPSTARIAE